MLGPGLMFRVETRQPEVFLTFDDGPIEGLTPWILDCLAEFGAKATFFMVGENVERNPHLVKRVLMEGHSVGNHTFNHLNGFRTRLSTYLDNVNLCESSIQSHLQETNARLFRPPYGCILPRQAYQIRKMGYRIVMWDILSKDYDSSVKPNEVVTNVLEHIRPGSIIVMHDNIKAAYNVRNSLPQILPGIVEAGLTFAVL